MAYTTKTKVENYLSILVPEALADSITEWTQAVQNYIYRYTGRKFDKAENPTTRKYDGNGQIRMEIDDFTEISKLTIYGIEVTADGYFLYPSNEPVKNVIELNQYMSALGNSRSGNFLTFDAGQQNVEVTGKFGWDDVPADIALAATKLVGGIIKEAIGDKDIKEVTREMLGDYQADYTAVSDIAHALKVTDLLDPYVRNGKVRTAVNAI